MTMTVSDDSRQPLIPNFLYTTTHSVSPILTRGGFRRLSILNRNNNTTSLLFPSTTCSPAKLHNNNVMIPAPDEPLDKITDCEVIGFINYGMYHLSCTPVDLLKCKMQIHPANWDWLAINYRIMKEQGIKGMYTGWDHNLIGFGVYGACKSGLYETFRKYYSGIAGSEYAAKHKTLINVISSGSAEVIASIVLCPLEAVKVRVQTQPGFASEFKNEYSKLYRSEGVHGFYKGLLPLWGRQIPYTMMQFALFGGIEEMLYKYWIGSPKNECNSVVEVGVIFAAGWMTAPFCTIVSHPADTLFTFLNHAKGATIGDAVRKFGLWGLCTQGVGLRMFGLGPIIAAECGLSLRDDELKEVNQKKKVDEFEKVNPDGDGSSKRGGGDDVWADQYFEYFD